MRIEKTKSAVKNITFGIINKFLSIIFPFVIKTIIIYKLGVEYLGLNSLFASVLNVLNFAEIGFGTAITFSMYKPVAEDDTESICALLNLYKKIYRIVGLIVVGCGIAIMPFLSFLIKGDVPADINLYTLYLVYLFNNVAGYFFFAYKSSLFSVYQKNDILSIISSIVNSICYVIQIAVLYIFPNYYAYIIFTPIATVVNNLVIGYISKKKFPNYVCKGNVSPERTAEIKKKVFGLVCHKVGSTVQSSIDNIAISAFLGLTILGVYNNYLYISSSIQSFITIFTSSITAGIGNNIYKDTKESNYNLFIRLNFACAIVIIFCSSCLLSLYQPFMKIWDKTNETLEFSVVILICILFYVSNIRSASGTYREALGIWDKDKLRPLIVTIVNLIGTIISAILGSLEGIIISTILAYALVSIYWETAVLYKEYFTRSKSEYFLKLLMYTIVACIVSFLTYLICEFLPTGGIKLFVLRSIVCVVVTILLEVLLLCWTNEFKYWINKIAKLFKRSRKDDKTN